MQTKPTLTPFYFILMISAALILAACDAPRDNPFDPEASNYDEPYRTKINVRQLYPPNVGIDNALILCPEINVSLVSNAQGMVEFEHKKIDSLAVSVFADGYFNNSVSFAPISMNNEFNLLLNALPVLTSSSFISVFDNYRNQTYLNFRAGLTDPDGPTDIDSVFLRLEGQDFKAVLLPSGINAYNVQFESKTLPGNFSAAEIPELSFDLSVKNINSDSVRFGPFRITRVIEENLSPLQPNESGSESGAILFTWLKNELNFHFTYKILLYRLAGTVQLITSIDGIPSGATEYLCSDESVLSQLTSGGYFWILQIEDRTGNLCQSEIVVFDYVRE